MVKQEIHTSRHHVRITPDVQLGSFDAARVKSVEGNQKIPAEEDVQFVRPKLVAFGVVANSVNDQKYIFPVVIHFGLLRLMPAVFYRKRVKLEQRTENFTFFLRWTLEIQPQHFPLLRQLADVSDGVDFFAVAGRYVSKPGDHFGIPIVTPGVGE
jgi:hypothetical protein